MKKFCGPPGRVAERQLHRPAVSLHVVGKVENRLFPVLFLPGDRVVRRLADVL